MHNLMLGTQEIDTSHRHMDNFSISVVQIVVLIFINGL